MTAPTLPSNPIAQIASADTPARRTQGRRTARAVHLALVPAVLMLLAFFGAPLVQLVRTSLSTWIGIGDMTWTGLDNYTEVLASEDFYNSLVASVILGLGTAIAITVIAVVLAALVSSSIRGSGFYRVLWFLPAIAPPAAVAVFWGLSFQPRTGVLNTFLGSVGLGDSHAWLADPDQALYAVMAVAVWQGVGFAFLILLGAVEEVPVSIYEAAAIDGASSVRVFFSMTLPMIRPVLSMVALLEVIWAFNAFTLVWALTTGGPGDATAILPVLVYKEAFQFGNFGPAAAVSVLGGIVLLVLGVVGQRLGGQKAVDA